MTSPRVFYGWWITISFSVMVFLSAGIRHAVGPFLKPMVADLGVDRASFSLVIALGLFLYGAFMPWVGSLADRVGPRLVTAAMRALERGDRAPALRTIERMRSTAEGQLAAGDSLRGREMLGIARTLEARDAMLRGETETALSAFESVYREGGFEPAGIWAAQILEEQGEIERAIEYLEQFGPNPLLGLWLGELYEQAERREEAIEAYGWVLLGWEGADPALQPQVARARQAIARLEGLRRG